MIAKYPASEYVRIIAPKVTAYKQEKKKLETAYLDSLNALASADSNGVNNLIPADTLISKQDTIQVALEDEQKTIEQKESVTEQKKLPVNKEPVWNPRRRR